MKYIIVCFLLLFCHLSNGQLTIGLKGNYALSFSKTQEIKLDDELDFLLYKMRFIEHDISPSFSVFSRYKNKVIFIASEISYRVSAFKFSTVNFLNYENLSPEFETKTLHQLIFPLQAGLHLEKIYFGVGPLISFTLSENNIFEDIEQFEERRRRLNAGFQYAVTIELYRLQIDMRFEQHFSGVGESFYFRGDNKGFANQSHLLVLGLAYSFSIN